MKSQQTILGAILDHLPEKPGVYKFFDKKGKIMYVGKAKNLKNRVRSYFRRPGNIRLERLKQNISDIQYVETNSELEALFLETNFIKALRPKFNIMMKDDKNYVYIKITTHEDFPRITLVRKIENDGARYFGPKTSAKSARILLKFLKKIFPYRHCSLDIDYVPGEGLNFGTKVTRKTMKYPCIDYYIHRCVAPCIANCSREEYGKIIQKVVDFLEGKEKKLLDELKQEMTAAAQEKKFELAANIRDKLHMIESLMERQIVSDPDVSDLDVFHYATRLDSFYFNLFMIREGKLKNQENFIFKTTELNDKEDHAEIIEAFLKQYYEKAAQIPGEILIPFPIFDQKLVASWLSQLRGKNVSLRVPKRGKKNHILELCYRNAESFAHQHEARSLHERHRTIGACEDLARTLNVQTPIRRIEGYDISHLGGTEIVASMVVFEDGMPKKSDYRRFRIKLAPQKIDDYLDMKEVLGRRLRQMVTSKKDQSLLGEYVFRKARKKDMPTLEGILKSEGLDCEALEARQFLVVELVMGKDGICGFGRLKEVQISEKEKVSELASIWVAPSQRGKHLGQELAMKLLKRSNHTKVYSINSERLEDYYAALGFHTTQLIPEVFRLKMEQCRTRECCHNQNILCMVYRVQKKKEDRSFRSRPDLILIDGGKGQLGVAEKVIGTTGIPVLALAKREEEVFIPGRALPLAKDSSALHLLMRVRDEAHRFAHEYSSNLHRKNLFPACR